MPLKVVIVNGARRTALESVERDASISPTPAESVLNTLRNQCRITHWIVEHTSLDAAVMLSNDFVNELSVISVDYSPDRTRSKIETRSKYDPV